MSASASSESRLEKHTVVESGKSIVHEAARSAQKALPLIVNSTSLSSPDGIFGEGRSYPQVPDVAAASGGRVRLAMRMTEYRGRFRHGAPAEAAWCSGACCRSPSITGKVSWWLVDGKDRRRRVYVYRSNLILNPCVYMAIFFVWFS
jgi:hypothetical protein